MILSMGQFMQWVGAQVQSTGTVQVWPGTPVAEVLIEIDNPTVAQASSPAGSPGVSPGVSTGSGTLPQPAAETDCATSPSRSKVVGVRLLDQGVDKKGNPSDGFTPGMDIHAALTVVADGPIGPIGRQLDEVFGLPDGHHIRDWAVGMKFVVDLPEDTTLKPGTVLHTFGYPEPEIFGFLYVHPDRVASLGIFVPSWFDSPARTAYRYLQHWMLHPYLWPISRAASFVRGARRRSANPAGAANRISPATATRASAKAASPRTSSPAPAWTKPGLPARNSPRPSSNCSRPRSRSPGKT
jgi:electron-transferring-flavoprotein dehydrogenase